MKHFSINSIALANLRGRKKTYITLAFAIVLAVYFAAVTLLFASSMFTSMNELHNRRNGIQDVILLNCKDAPLDELVKNGAFSEYGKASVMGYAVTNEKSASGGFSIASFDETALRLARKKTVEGRLPQKAGEIAIEKSMLARLRTDAGIGGKVSLMLKIPDGAGFLKNTATKTYTLTGILEDQLIYMNRWDDLEPAYGDYPAAVVSGEEEIEAGGKPVIKCYGSYAGEAEEGYKKVAEFCLQYGLKNAYGSPDFNSTHYAGLFGGGIEQNGDQSLIFSTGFLAAIALILMFASCLGIVNAFSANLEDRKRQIGLIRAVGATRKQIRGIFGREALILACISIPLGVLLACLTVWGIGGLLGGNYIFSPNSLIIAGVAVFGALCVMLSAGIPLKKASAIPPMQAIRDVALSRKMRKRSVKSTAYFDVPRMLAHRSLTLYKSKRLGITAMLAVSVILISLVTFIAGPMMREATQNGYTADFEISRTNRTSEWLIEEDFHAPGITEQDRTDAAALSGVARVYGQKTFQVKILVDKLTPYLTTDGYGYDFNYLMRKPPKTVAEESGESDEFWAKENDIYLASKQKYNYISDYLTVDCGGMDERTIMELSNYVSEGRIDPQKLASGEEILIVAPAEYGFRKAGDHGDGFYTHYTIDPNKKYMFTAKNDSFRAGDKITLSLLYTDEKLSYADSSLVLPDKVTRLDKTVTIGAVIDPALDKKEKIYSLGTGLFFFEQFSVCTTHAGLSALGFDVPYESLSIYLNGSPDAVQEEYLTKNLENIAAKTPSAELQSYIAMARENRETALQMLIAGAAVVILFFAICASMVNNSVSARIRAGRREIGTLRAVGASRTDIVRSYLWELLSMFTWGMAIGIAAELAICQWLILSKKLADSTFTLPIWQPIVFVFILFLICFMNIRSKVSGIAKGSIVENIREL